MIVYIAGPMRGIPYYNFPAFDGAEAFLHTIGHTCINPAQMDRDVGFDAMSLPKNYDWSIVPYGFDKKAAILRDTIGILNSDAIYLLPGWEQSVGATAEYHVSKWAGIPIFKLKEPSISERD